MAKSQGNGKSSGRKRIRRRNNWGRTKAGTHVSIMVREVIQYLEPKAGEIMVDCTVGFGGHSREFAWRIGESGRLLALDIDAEELAKTQARLANLAPATSFHHANYADLPAVLAEAGLERCDIIFADVGLSSMQIDDESRGVSYKHDAGPLDMRMDRRQKVTAADLLMSLSEQELSSALQDLSDEADHERIAAWIVAQRQVAPITEIPQLKRLVLGAKGLSENTWRDHPSSRYGELHPAARTFQALRILVNGELDSLQGLLVSAPGCLNSGGRIGVLSFHSGEDRLVKRAFRDGHESGVYQATSPKPIAPRPAEVKANPRSSSAKFRWARMA